MEGKTDKKYLKWYQKVAYGAGDLASNCSYGLVSSFVLLYLTSTMGLNSVIIGNLMLLSKVLDGVSDAVFGTMIDRTHSKLGKARPWMLYAQIGVSVCLFLIFSIPEGSEAMQYAWFFVTYTALNAIFYTANGIAYSSLTALITRNSNERVQLGSIRFMFAVVTNIAMGYLVTNMVEWFGGGAAGWRTTAFIFALIALAVNTISCLSVKELPPEESDGQKQAEGEKKADIGLWQSIKILLHNKYYLLIVAIYIVYYIMSNLTTGAGIFFATYFIGDGSVLGTLSMMKMFPVIIALAVSPAIIKKVGNIQKVNFWGYAISCFLGIPVIYFAWNKKMSVFLLFMFLKGVFAGTLSGSLNALIAEASAYTTRTTGIRMDGMMYSCSSLGVKVGGGIGTAATGWLLALGGFKGTEAVQSAGAINMTFHCYITIPFLIGVIITVLLAFLDVEKANRRWDETHPADGERMGV